MLFAVALCAALGMVTFYAQAPAGGQKPASADPYANNPDAGKQKFPLAAPAGKDSGAKDKPLAGAVNTGSIDPATWKYGPNNTPPAGREALESGQAEAAAGRQGDRRHRVQRDRSAHLLRDGERRLRLHLDRDAAQRSRLEPGRAHVAHLPAREGGSRRAHRIRR